MLNKKIFIKGEIIALSGITVGGSNTSLGIGGLDKTVIRNPLSKEPFIPGSSLKGKMRSLLEVSYGVLGTKMSKKVQNGPNEDPRNITTVLFGSARSEEGKETQRPSRIIVRDGALINGLEFRDKTDLPFTESKTEVVIDRITSAAMPRTFERVPAGARFELDIVLNIFEKDSRTEDELLTLTFKGLQMIQDDYLGGSGSRGSGRVKFRITSIKERLASYYHEGNMEAEIVRNDEIPGDLQ